MMKTPEKNVETMDPKLFFFFFSPNFLNCNLLQAMFKSKFQIFLEQ